MRHLSDAELVDAAERTLAPARHSHLESCDRCRAAAAALESMHRDVAAVDVPEPSPLFWDHFSARVHAAVAAATPVGSRWAWASLRAPWIQIAAFGAVVIAVAATTWFARPSGERTPAPTVALTAPSQHAPAVTSASQEIADTDDLAWTVLSAAAADLSDQDTPASTLTVRPAAVDTAVQQLTPPERQELRRLLQSEMRRSSD